MSHEHKLALERIVTLCEKSRQPTERIERIFDIALGALGLTANQRAFEIEKMRQSAIQKQRDKIEARMAKYTEKQETACNVSA